MVLGGRVSKAVMPMQVVAMLVAALLALAGRASGASGGADASGSASGVGSSSAESMASGVSASASASASVGSSSPAESGAVSARGASAGARQGGSNADIARALDALAESFGAEKGLTATVAGSSVDDSDSGAGGAEGDAGGSGGAAEGAASKVATLNFVWEEAADTASVPTKGALSVYSAELAALAYEQNPELNSITVTWFVMATKGHGEATYAMTNDEFKCLFEQWAL